LSYFRSHLISNIWMISPVLGGFGWCQFHPSYAASSYVLGISFCVCLWSTQLVLIFRFQLNKDILSITLHRTKAEATLEVYTLPAGNHVHSIFNTCSITTNTRIFIILPASKFPSKMFMKEFIIEYVLYINVKIEILAYLTRILLKV
jgi:hypothetical protein